MDIGKYNKLTVARLVEFGAYLTDAENKPEGEGKEKGEKPQEVLLPNKYVPEGIRPGDELNVFVYTDSEDRIVATTLTPFATVGEFAYLQVNQVNKVGAFLDWGLEKDLLVPFSEQRSKMMVDGIYLVYVYLDHNTGRVVASAKVEKFLGNVIPEYRRGQQVSALVCGHNEVGYRAIVDNLFWGMIYDNELYSPIEVEQVVTAYVKQVRPDNKIDLTLLQPAAAKRVASLGDKVLDLIRAGKLNLTDRSTPEEIKERLQCSKKDFKKTLGALYRQHLIVIDADGTCRATD
jgi:predicted RNA-binding protein (virulence factor B family)